MAACGVITLLTDFGSADPFVGVMKGVILERFAEAALVDLSHAVPPHDIRHGAFWLERSFSWFPSGTVHLAVVDPGVGGERRALAARSGGHYFVGPDNGLLTAALERASADGPIELYRIDLEKLLLATPSRTFHGRDVFAPVAALIASGRLGVDETGYACSDPIPSPLRAPERDGHDLTGEVAVVDRFGNLISNIAAELLPPSPTVIVAERELTLCGTYSDVALGEPMALIGSLGTVEIAVRDGSASERLGLRAGARIVVR